MLLVDDDEAEVDERREHRRARADDDAHLAARHGAVGEQPLPRRQPGVQDGDLLAGEAPLDARHRLAGEPDLGHQEQDRAAGLQRRLRGLQVHLGLAAAGDAVQQHLVAGVRLAEDAVQRAPLLVEQVGDVRERGAGAQAAGLRRGGGRGGAGGLAVAAGAGVRSGPARRRVVFAPGSDATTAPLSSSRLRPAAERPLAARSSRSSRRPGVVDELEGGALPRAETRRRLRDRAAAAPRRRGADTCTR